MLSHSNTIMAWAVCRHQDVSLGLRLNAPITFVLNMQPPDPGLLIGNPSEASLAPPAAPQPKPPGTVAAQAVAFPKTALGVILGIGIPLTVGIGMSSPICFRLISCYCMFGMHASFMMHDFYARNNHVSRQHQSAFKVVPRLLTMLQVSVCLLQPVCLPFAMHSCMYGTSDDFHLLRFARCSYTRCIALGPQPKTGSAKKTDRETTLLKPGDSA